MRQAYICIMVCLGVLLLTTACDRSRNPKEAGGEAKDTLVVDKNVHESIMKEVDDGLAESAAGPGEKKASDEAGKGGEGNEADEDHVHGDHDGHDHAESEGPESGNDSDGDEPE